MGGVVQMNFLFNWMIFQVSGVFFEDFCEDFCKAMHQYVFSKENVAIHEEMMHEITNSTHSPQ